MLAMTSAPTSGLASPSAGRANVSVSADTLMRGARGFSCVFWGLPHSLLLYTGAVDIRLFPRVRVPAFVLGVFVIYCGLVFLQRIGPLTALWQKRVKAALFLLLLEVYLAPFLFWWRRMPYVPYYLANALVLLVCTAMGLFVLNKLGGEIARTLHDPALHAESQISAWLSAVLLLVPAAAALLRSTSYAFDSGASLLQSILASPFQTPHWLNALAVLPFTLTMAIAWKAKERCLRALKTMPHPPPEPSIRMEVA